MLDIDRAKRGEFAEPESEGKGGIERGPLHGVGRVEDGHESDEGSSISDSSGLESFNQEEEISESNVIRRKGSESSLLRRVGEQIERLKSAERGYLPLEGAMRDSLGLAEDARSSLSRRQLQKIVEGEDIPLRFEQIEQLDRFLRLRAHIGLADLLNPPSVLRLMAEEGKIGFVMGSQPDRGARRIDFSRWDIKSMQVIQRHLYAMGKPLQISIDDVILRGKTDVEVFHEGAVVPDSEDWYRQAENLDSPGESLIVLGSPRVNHGAEKVLAGMLGVKPFEEWPEDRIDERPFAFFWPDWIRNPNRPGSCLHFDPIEHAEPVRLTKGDRHFLRALVSEDDGREPEEARRYDCGVVANRRFYPIVRGKREWKTYAIIAARRGTHRTCACICGATGPGTLAAARIFERFVPRFMPGAKDHRTAWCLVEADVRDEGADGAEGGDSFRADQRRVIDQRIVDNEIHFYPPGRR